jgi:N-acetylneuraminic acid mutarotase
LFSTIAIALAFSSHAAFAHMAWLATDDDKHVVFWFGESPSDRTYHMPDKVASIQLHTDPGKETLETSKIDEDDFVGLRSKTVYDSDAEISGRVTYGLYHGMKLTYHVEHLPSRDPTTWPTTARQNTPLQTVVTPASAGGVLVSVLKDGKPVSDVEVTLYCEKGHQEDSQTTDSAGMVTFKADVVESGLNSVMVAITDDDATGELNGQSYKGSADYLTSTFYRGKSQRSGEKKKKPAVKIDANSGVSINAANLPDLPEELTSFGAAIAGQKLYVYGGHTGSAHSYSTEEQSDRFRCLDLAAGSEGQWQDLPGGPKLQGLALVAHGKDLIRVGGFTARNEPGAAHDLHSQSSVAKFSPAVGKWTDLPNLPEPRSSLDAAVLGDRIFVFGGWHMSGDSEENHWHDTAWSLDLSDEQAVWKAIAKPPFRRRAVSVAAYDAKLYVIGGMQAAGGPTTRVDVYDPSSDSWSKCAPLPGSGMSGFGSSAFATAGSLYVTTMDGFVHRLNAATETWRTVAKSDPARFFHRMLPANKDTLIVLGGANMEIGKFTHIDAIHLKQAP